MWIDAFLILLVAAALFFAVRKIVRDRRRGKGCSCGCGSGASCDRCRR